MVEVYAVCLNFPLPRPVAAALESLIPLPRLGELGRFRKPEDCGCGLAAEAMIRRLLSDRLGIDCRSLVIRRNEFGKPFVQHEYLQFNCSHSGQWVVAAIDDQPVGIDVEEMAPVDLNIARNYFSDLEYDDLMMQSDQNRPGYFYDLWTLKESYIKAVGRGLSLPLKSFAIRKHCDGRITMEKAAVADNYYFKQYDVAPGYKFSVCGRKRQFPAAFKLLRLDEIAAGMS